MNNQGLPNTSTWNWTVLVDETKYMRTDLNSHTSAVRTRMTELQNKKN